MRECGGCTLCCKIPRIVELDKPSNQWCPFCEVGHSCRIYDGRPKVCKDFTCWWLDHLDMPEEYRPDRVHFYVAGHPGDDVIKVRVDPRYPEAWKDSPVVNQFLEGGQHLMIVIANQVTFLPGTDRPPPDKIMLEWTL